jgi:DNA-binding transcriptional ArsR family regulator
LHLLAKHGPMTSTAMMPHLGLTQPTVSHHLRGLEQAGLIAVIDIDGAPWRQIEFDAVSDLAGLIDPHRPASRPSMPVCSGTVVRHSGEVSA